MKRFLECGHPNNELELGKETSSFAPDPSEFRRLAEVAAEAQGLPAPTDGKMPGTRPLIAAAVSGHSHVAWELLLSSADVNATDSDELTALSAASYSTACDIHMWFLLHRAAGQKQQQIHQSSALKQTSRRTRRGTAACSAACCGCCGPTGTTRRKRHGSCACSLHCCVDKGRTSRKWLVAC